MKKIVRLTENDLTKLVKKVVLESVEKDNLIKLLNSVDIANVKLGLELYKNLGIKIDKKIIDWAKINVLIDEYEWDYDTIKTIVEDIFIDSPRKLEYLEEKEDYIYEILKHIKKGIKTGDWGSMEEWFKDVDESYN
jgi:hypothetical protein